VHDPGGLAGRSILISVYRADVPLNLNNWPALTNTFRLSPLS